MRAKVPFTFYIIEFIRRTLIVSALIWVMILPTWAARVHLRHRMEHWIPTDGYVVDCSRGGRKYHYMTFKYTVGLVEPPQTYTDRQRVSRLIDCEVLKGRTVEIRYSPYDPAESIISGNRIDADKWVPLINIFGYLFVFIALIAPWEPPSTDDPLGGLNDKIR